MSTEALAPLPTLHPDQLQLGSAPSVLADELRYFIMLHASKSPRSLQAQIGPSQVGTPCDRKLAFMVTQTAPSGAPRFRPSWRSSVGTAVHEYLADVFASLNNDTHDEHGYSRFLIETRVNVGEIGGEAVTGSADLYDRVTATVVDWKVTGPTTIKSARANGPAQTYRVQTQLYARGFVRRGVPVERVAIMYLPSSGDIHDAYMWSAPYDEEIAVAALRRADAIAWAMKEAGAGRMVPALATADDYCSSCPWFRQGASPDGNGCPGHMRTPGPLPAAADVLRGAA